MVNTRLPAGFSIPCPFCGAEILRTTCNVRGSDTLNPQHLQHANGRQVLGIDPLRMKCSKCGGVIGDVRIYIQMSFAAWLEQYGVGDDDVKN
jgi:uncharacterized Zn-finger protein